VCPQLPVDETVRDLGEKTGPVAGPVGGAGPAMVQVDQALDGETGHPVAGNAIQGGDEPDAAGITVGARIEERCGHRSQGFSGSDAV
jgi:hypothetical protein